MTVNRLPDMYVLDALASDIEDLEGILRMLNSETELGWHKEWGRKFSREEIVEALCRLVSDDLVLTYVTPEKPGLVALAPRALPPGDFDDAWFGLTEKGRLVHANWEPGGAGLPGEAV